MTQPQPLPGANRPLTARQRELYDAIIGGQRSQGPQHFDLVDEHGQLVGPFGVMLKVPELGIPLQGLGSALRYAGTLTDRERELVILAIAHVTDNAFERYAHEAVGRAVGLDQSELDSLAHGLGAGATARERAVVELARALASEPVAPTSLLRELELTQTGEEVVLEVVVLAGYYRLIAQMMEIFGVGVPGGTQQEEVGS